jgi:hypothetical protein
MDNSDGKHPTTHVEIEIEMHKTTNIQMHANGIWGLL